MTVRVLGTVVSVEVDPQLRHALRRHLVSVRVDEVLEGDLAERELTLLVHSPSRTFAEPDPVGEQYVLALSDPISDPYAGDFEVEAPDAAATTGLEQRPPSASPPRSEPHTSD